MFPDSDPANKNRNSLEMLSLAVESVNAKGFAVAHADVTVIAERPRIGQYRSAIRERLSTVLHVKPDAESLKGKTNEGMGWIGRGEGIACIAVVTLADSRG
jgi:2-C-methyl-D-erythritol 2,4-cyclodiphosphate synthase